MKYTLGSVRNGLEERLGDKERYVKHKMLKGNQWSASSVRPAAIMSTKMSGSRTNRQSVFAYDISSLENRELAE
jgi:hypothetical protein